MDTGQTSSATALITLVVPVYNEESVLPAFHRRAQSMLNGLAPQYAGQILFVNDGSTDRSLEILLQLRQTDTSVQIISLSRNFGHQLAITAGLDYAEGDAVVVIDSDLQDPPELIPAMLARWQEGMKVVYGVRRRREGESIFKRWTAALYYRLLQRLSDTGAPVDAGDFRLLDQEVVKVIRELREHSRYVRGLVSWVGFSQCEVPYDRAGRCSGTTKYPLGKMLALAMNGIVNFTERPLYWVGYLGFFTTLVSVVVIFFVLFNKILHPETTVRGWNSLILAVSFFGGIQLLTIGVLGQYVGRIYSEVKNRPLYVIAGKTGLKPRPDNNGRETGQRS